VEAPIQHISPEEAVAHIQALLDAKHERVQRGPSWPGANPTHAAGSNGQELHPPVSGDGGAGDGRAQTSQRNEQGKRKG
jgi:hypothetical protein